MTPRVTVICLCYNHASHVVKALQSVLDQDYENIQLMVVDDASTDDSVATIQSFCSAHTEIQFIGNDQNLGNCISFNKAFAHADGDFIIDLAADDVLEPTRVRKGVTTLEAMGDDFGIHYSDAWHIDAEDQLIGLHSNSSKSIAKDPFPEGDLFSEILRRYFICPPTVMVKRQILEDLGGYDESLSYEDFDLYVRSARITKFCASPEPLVIKRILGQSKSARQSKDAAYYRSTLAVCQKAYDLLKNDDEKKGLQTRVRFECREAIRHKQLDVIEPYLEMMKSLHIHPLERTVYAVARSLR